MCAGLVTSRDQRSRVTASEYPPIWVAARLVVVAADTVPEDCYAPLADLPVA